MSELIIQSIIVNIVVGLTLLGLVLALLYRLCQGIYEGEPEIRWYLEKMERLSRLFVSLVSPLRHLYTKKQQKTKTQNAEYDSNCNSNPKESFHEISKNSCSEYCTENEYNNVNQNIDGKFVGFTPNLENRIAECGATNYKRHKHLCPLWNNKKNKQKNRKNNQSISGLFIHKLGSIAIVRRIIRPSNRNVNHNGKEPWVLFGSGYYHQYYFIYYNLCLLR